MTTIDPTHPERKATRLDVACELTRVARELYKVAAQVTSGDWTPEAAADYIQFWAPRTVSKLWALTEDGHP